MIKSVSKGSGVISKARLHRNYAAELSVFFFCSTTLCGLKRQIKNRTALDHEMLAIWRSEMLHPSFGDKSGIFRVYPAFAKFT